MRLFVPLRARKAAQRTTLRAGVMAAAAALVGLGSALQASGAEAPEEGVDVVIQVSGFDNERGRLRCGLFKNKDWPEEKGRIAGVVATIKGKRATCRFSSVAPGRYAIAAYHDKNDNGRLDKNFLGIPSEDFCFSQGAQASMGPPSFKEAAFEVGGEAFVTKCKL